ncbi:MAG: NADH-quinone oxidoreductase subunit K [Candidatus Omnitrophica bacterium]|nr:NADH-quinone oxidoreductase subunit K [Candidatus Omnitrophota bacterium]
MSATLQPYLLISTLLLCLGLYGVLTRRNLIAVLISLELILNSASLNFVAFGRFHMADPSAGQVFAIFIIALAAAEVCVALSLILLLFRQRRSVDPASMDQLKG